MTTSVIGHLDTNMGWPPVAGVVGVSAAAAFLALSLPLLFSMFFSFEGLMSFVPGFPLPDFPSSIPYGSVASTHLRTSVCEPSAYRTEIISLDPLLIYIHGFLRPEEIDSLLTVAEPLFKPSQVTKSYRKVNTSDRTSSTAGLSLDDPMVQCILSRARGFMGAVMADGKDEMGPPQLVRYTSGQKFNLHHDFYETPQWAYDGSRRKFNRVASFFAILQDNCTDGETYFPHIRGTIKSDPGAADQSIGPRTWNQSDSVMRLHEDGGLAFRPIKGNALFWMNLRADGTGDERTMHAGLPVGEGLKTAMNIWPRQFYPID